jgi:AdoMet-dependent heme synthase
VSETPGADQLKPTFDFAQSPFLVLWELTRACALACRHCRAEAVPEANQYELSLTECCQLLAELKKFGHPLIVLTGGDPARRRDLFEIIAEGRRQGLKIAMTPSATPTMTPGLVKMLKHAGLERLAISLDASSRESHDDFRRVSGSYDMTLAIVNWARKYELPVQINTTITKHNYADFEEMAKLVGRLGAVLWSVFFLVPTGRANRNMQISSRQAEVLLERMAELAASGEFDIKSTAAPHFRRVLLQKEVRRGQAIRQLYDGAALQTIDSNLNVGELRSYQSVNDGKGLIFISDVGDIQPSGFLPLVAGNVRRDSIVDVYRNSSLFTQLRCSQAIKGKCGFCRYRDLCGGSRARAYALTNDYMQSDPLCSYVEKQRCVN